MQDALRSAALWLLPIFTWACVLALAVLSLLPAADMPRTGWPDFVNHFIAYAGTAAITTACYRRTQRGGWMIIVLLCSYAAILEYLQRFAPGRDPDVVDFIASSLGAICGTAATAPLWPRLVRLLPVGRAATEDPG